MKHPLLSLIGAIIVAWSLPGGSSIGQMGYTARSLEWLVVDSDVAVRASVTMVDRTPVVYTGDGVQGNPEVWKTVTLRVHETLKGKPAGSLTFIERTLDSNRIYEEWRDAGGERLWFLVRSTRQEGGDGDSANNIAPHDHLTSQGVISLSAPVIEERDFTPIHPLTFSMNLNILKKPNEILDAARFAVENGGEQRPVREHAITVPRHVMQRSGRSGDGNSLIVPIDQRLENLGQRLIEEPGTFLERADFDRLHKGSEQRMSGAPGALLAKVERVSADWLRREGVKILHHFPTKENMVLLKSLLDDPASLIQVGPGETREKVYFIREAAYEALQAWDADVSKPVLRVDSPEP